MKAIRLIITVSALVSLLSVSFALAGPVGAHTVYKGHVSKKTQAHKMIIGLVTDIGGLNDRSFNHLAWVGLQRAKAQLGINAQVEQSSTQADYIPNLTHFAQEHAALTIAVGFLMANAIYKLAKEYPHNHFAIVDSTPQLANGTPVILKNVKNLLFREQESGYLVGVIAGLMEKHKIGAAKNNTISWLGGLSIPPVNRYICGYIAGAKKVDPSIKVLGSYDQTFTDTAKAKSFGLTHIAEGSDILFQVDGGAGLGYLQAAGEKGKYGIGVDADEDYYGPYVITSALKKVDVAVYDTIKSVVEHRFVGGTRIFSLKDNATGYATDTHHVPAFIKAVANRYARLIAKGKIVPPATCKTSA
jgi:basic membrane protein A